MKISKNGNLTKTYQGKYVADEETLKSIKAHLNAESGNPHKVTASDVGAYTKEEVDKKLEEIGGSVDAYTKAETDDLLSDKADAAELAKVKFDILGLPTFNDVYTKAETNKQIKSASRYTYYTPSAGLVIEDGTVVGIGTCLDEHIVIPELYNDGGVKKPVYRIARDVFGSLLGDKGVQIKSITFPYSIKELSPHTIDSWRCPNLESVYLMNPDVSWDKDEISLPFYFEANVKDIYFGFSAAQYYEMIERNGGALITLRNENIAAGIVPTLHFGHFVTSAVIGDINGKIGNIDVALDELHTYAQALIGGEA